MASETKPELHVTVWLGDVTTDIHESIPAVRSVAGHRGARDLVVNASEDGTELTAAFVLDGVDEGEAREVGHAVLGALEAEDCVWTVTVLEPS